MTSDDDRRLTGGRATPQRPLLPFPAIFHATRHATGLRPSDIRLSHRPPCVMARAAIVILCERRTLLNRREIATLLGMDKLTCRSLVTKGTLAAHDLADRVEAELPRLEERRRP